MENRIKEQQLDLFADRTSSATMTANQLRLWFSSMAYVLLNELRRIALRHTRFADATCGTIRLKLLKIGALVRRSVRRIKFAMASGFPSHNEFALAYQPGDEVALRSIGFGGDDDNEHCWFAFDVRHDGDRQGSIELNNEQKGALCARSLPRRA